MESATVPRLRIRRPAGIELGLILLLLALAAVAWLATGDRMSGMDAGPGTDPGSLGFYVTAWVVMMAAMMFPSIWPMVTMYRRIQASKREKGQDVQAGATTLFVAGYLIIWTVWGLAAYAVFKIGQSVWPDSLSWSRGGPYVAGGIIIAAGIYQLTPLKNACLTKCRNPVMFLMTSWKQGRAGALRMGIEHGGWCVGCCWGLMLALFALGVMSIGWMVFIAALIAIEKLLPWRAVANYGIAVLLLVIGIFVAATPESVPGLTLPDSPKAMRAMESMQGGSMKDQSMPAEPMKEKSMPSEPMNGR